MRISEVHNNIAELKYKNGLFSPKFITVHKIQFEDELEDSVHKRKIYVKKKEKKSPYLS